ncbi:MAG: sugar phosphate isomerase/epimerase [Pirellulales bacterium]|nr:sugar phosphate isomerase/epimerase [Pirellulales bacterium]
MLGYSNRREFLASMTALGASLSAATAAMPSLLASRSQSPLFKISLAQWSLHVMLRKGELTNLDFPGFTKSEFDIDAVEYVNSFFKDKAKDHQYLKELKQRTGDLGITNLLIMCDGEGQLGAPEQTKRSRAVENHYKWVEAAKFLGCHSIRVNAASRGSFQEQQLLVADGLRRLAKFGAQHDINVIVENHGGFSSHGGWLASVIKAVDMPNCGTLPDFGNFKIGKNENGLPKWYDRYQGVTELMPYAKAVSAKTYEFDEQGSETKTDYRKMMRIVLDAGYRGYVGIEWEGKQPSEVEGIKLTKQLLERVRSELTAEIS